MITKPVKHVRKNDLVKHRILGIPISYSDRNTTELEIEVINSLVEPERLDKLLSLKEDIEHI